MYNYVNIIDNKKQFGALSIRLNDKSVYVSYEGTDNTLVGWKEDFKMACNYPIPSQLLAMKYLNRTLKFSDTTVRLGGHSKGGNLAVSAAMGCHFYLKGKIIAIYNNDGPGFLKEQVISRNYQKIMPKIKMFVPKQSVVGMLLYHQVDYKVVKSNKRGIFQHDAFTWQCQENSFELDSISTKSKKIYKGLNEWLENLSPEKRQQLVEEIFEIFENNDIKFTSDIKLDKIFSLLKSINNMDKEIKRLIIELVKLVVI